MAAVVIAFGVVLYGNGVGAVPDEPVREPAATREGMRRISWGDLGARMKTSVKDLTDHEADRAQRLSASGAFLVLVGLALVVLAVIAFIVAMV